jgi:hypothetical protein
MAIGFRIGDNCLSWDRVILRSIDNYSRTKHRLADIMNQPPTPDPEKIKKTVRELKALCRQFDLLNFQLEELTAYVDAEIRKSPLTAYRLGKTPQPEIDRD